VKQDQESEADAELHSKRGPINPDKGNKAKEKLEFEDRGQQHFTLGQ
jgi:hypothetical protein